MIKKIISLLLTISMLSGMIIVLAESEEVTVTSNGIISTENFTEDNVIYNALQNNNGGVSLYSDTSSAGITADFDIVFGLDMSSDMSKFDYNIEKEWLEYFCALAEQGPEGARFTNIGEEESLFTEDLNQIINGVKERSYSENNDILNVLDNSMNMFDEASANRNKIVIATTTNISDVTAFETKQAELLNYGIIPFVFILNDDKNSNISNLEYVYQCGSLIELRIALSDLYGALSEFSEATAVASLSIESVASTEATTVEYLSDFRDINKFSNATNKGAMLASILSIYGAVPLRAKVGTNTYDLTEISGEKLDEFMVRNNAEFSNGEDLVEFHTAWDEICTTLESSTYFDAGNQADTILYNLKRKFPVLLNRTSGYEIITKCTYIDGQWVLYTADNEQIQLLNITSSDKVFDTYEYLTSIVNNKEIGVSISNFITELDENGKANIVGMHVELKYPDNYEMVDEKYPVETVVTTVEYGEDINAETIDENAGIGLVTTSNPVILTITRQEGIDSRYIVVSSLVTYNGAIPDLCNANKRFRDLLYTDEDDTSIWYYDHLFKLTNLGILNGDENRRFNAENSVTRAEFVTMALRAAEIKVEDVAEGQHWAYNLLEKAIELGMIRDCTKDELPTKIDSIASDAIDRGEAAYILYKLFIKSAAEVNVPTTLYDYINEFVNVKSNDWAKNEAFADQSEILNTDNEESIYQMFLNNIIEGIKESDGKRYYRATSELTRAQCATIISRCLFDLEEYKKTVELTIKDDYSDNFDGELSTLIEGVEEKGRVEQKGCLETEDDVDCFAFIPKETGSYEICTNGTTDMAGILYDSDKITPICESYDAPDSANCWLARTLEGGKIYYVKLFSQNSSKGAYTIETNRFEEPNDKYFEDQWGLMNTGQTYQYTQSDFSKKSVVGEVGWDCNILPAWKYSTGEGVTVAVLDTGVDISHEELRNKTVPGYNYIHGNEDVFPTDEPNQANKESSAAGGHGTRSAGIIVATRDNVRGIAGIAPDANVLPIKMMGNGVTYNAADVLVNSINHAKNNNAKIVNCSFGGAYSSDVEEAIKAAPDILFVAGVGNNGVDMAVAGNEEYPASYPLDNIIAVSGVDADGECHHYSNYGGCTHVAAPGSNIVSTHPGNSYRAKDGTSVAAPIVSGVAALIMSYYPDLTVAEVKNKIINPNNVWSREELSNKVLSGGMVNAVYALSNNSTPTESLQGEMLETNEEKKMKILETMATTEDKYKTNQVIVNTSNEELKNKIINRVFEMSVTYEFVKDVSLTGSIVLEFDSIENAENAVIYLNSQELINYAEINYLYFPC